MSFLIDVNVWVALAVGEHVHHAAAEEWLDQVTTERIAFCRVVQMGLLRLLTNPHVMGKDICSAASAWAVLDSFAADSRVVFAVEPDGLVQAWRETARDTHSGVNFWTDAYLAAFAAAAGYTLVTFDRGFTRYKDIKLELLRG